MLEYNGSACLGQATTKQHEPQQFYGKQCRCWYVASAYLLMLGPWPSASTSAPRQVMAQHPVPSIPQGGLGEVGGGPWVQAPPAVAPPTTPMRTPLILVPQGLVSWSIHLCQHELLQQVRLQSSSLNSSAAAMEQQGSDACTPGAGLKLEYPLLVDLQLAGRP